jgi:multidrug efflux pump subunit AcrA (membrane-fusion protein)
LIQGINFKTLSFTTTRTQLGKARIQLVRTQTTVGKARIQLVTKQTQLGKARIQVSTTQTVLGKARIIVTTSQTQLGKSRIKATATQTVLGKARITATTTQTILGKARITIVTTQTQLGKSRITATTNQTQLGKGNIRNTTSQTQLGKARIQTIVGPNYALKFDGSQNYLNLGTLGSLGSNLSSGFYLKFELTTTQTALGDIAGYNANGATDFTQIDIGLNLSQYSVATPGQMYVYIESTDQKVLLFGLTTAYNFYDGQKHTIEIICVPSTNTSAIYIDGVSQAVTNKAAQSPSNFINLDNGFQIGSYPFGHFAAVVDNVSIGTSASNLYGKYLLNEGTGTTTADSSGNGNTGTLTGSPLPIWVTGLSPNNSIAGLARIQLIDTKTQLGKARITVTTLQTILGKARLQVTTVQTQLGKGNIAALSTQTILGKARITAKTTQTQLGKANIRATTTQTQTGKARIQLTTTQTILGKSRIQLVTNQTILGKARVTATATKTQLGKSRIQSTATKTTLGKARIQVVDTVTQLGKARITATTSHTQLGKSRVTATTTQVQLGKARVTATTTQTVQGKARIQLTTSHTILGIARILVTGVTTQTILGKARITATTLQTQLGKARVTAIGKPLLNNLAAYYKFDENSGTTVGDSLGVDTGTWQNTSGSQWGTGKINSGANFLGGTDFIELNNPTNINTLGSSDFSIFAWVKTSSTGVRKSIFSFGAGSTNTNQGGYLFINSANKVEFDLVNVAGAASSVTVTDNAFHLVGIINTAGSIQIYVDGVASGSPVSMSPNISSGNARIGRDLSNDFQTDPFIGIIDELGIWSRALTQWEVVELYNNNVGLQYNFGAPFIFGLARITAITNQTILGKSRITAATIETQLGKARIQITTGKTQLGKARIQVIDTQTVLGKARITVNSIQTQQGKARIQTTSTQVQLGRSRIQLISVQVQQGKSRITGSTLQSQLGKANLSKLNTQTITGVARLTRIYPSGVGTELRFWSDQMLMDYLGQDTEQRFNSVQTALRNKSEYLEMRFQGNSSSSR